MRIEHLVEKKLPADTILKEMGIPKSERQVIMEFLPLIPVALWAGGAAWTAYDTYKAKKAYDAGEITQAELATRVGTDVAISIAGGILAKAVGKGFKVGKAIYKSKKAAKEAQKKTANIPTPKDAAIPPTGINVVANATTTTATTSAKKTVQTAKPGDIIKTKKGQFLAGVDGKATTTRVSAPNAAEIKKQILKISDTSVPSAATVVTTKTVSKTLDKLAGKVDPALQKAADAAKKVSAKVVDKVKDLTKKTDISAPASSIAAKSGTKVVKQKLTKAQQNALSNMGNNLDVAVGNVAAKSGTKVVKKAVKQKLTKTQRDALSNMTSPVSSIAAKSGTKVVNKAVKKVDAKLQKAADDLHHKKNVANIKKNNNINTAGGAVVAKGGSKVVVKKLDDIKKPKKKKTDKDTKKKKSKLGSYWSNLNKGSYWDTNLSGVASKYSNF